MTSRAEKLRAEVPSAEEFAALAARHGLERSGVRPPLGKYVAEIWRQRRFLWTLSSAESYARHQDNYLGQLWALLNPLFLAGAYYLVFGKLLGTDGGTSNYVGFLIVGLFLFIYSAGNMTGTSKSVSKNLNLVRSLKFPRALLPLSVSLTEFIAVLPTLVVLLAILLLSGETINVLWLLFPIVVFLHLLINVGVGLILARIVHSSRDLRNLIPVAVRLLRYISGVFFSIDHYAGAGIIGTLMKYQPFALILDIARQSLLGEFPIDPSTWFVAAAWAILLPIVGIVVFWSAEATYGRN